MDNTILISVVVPVYNAMPRLKLTLEALQAQTMQGIEFILIDDGSTDESPAYCRELTSCDSRFVYYRKKNAGVSAARNDGIRLSRGQWLMFCDSDDIPSPKLVQSLYEKAVETQADCVLCDFQIDRGASQTAERLRMTRNLEEKKEIMDCLILPMCIWGYGARSIYGSVWRGLYHKKILSQSNTSIRFPEDIRLGEDMLFNISFWNACRRISFVPEVLYSYIENPDSASHTDYSARWDRQKQLWKKATSLLDEIGISEEQKKWQNFQLTRYAVDSIIFGVCTQPCSKPEKWKQTAQILATPELRKLKNKTPQGLDRKNRLLLAFLKPIFAPLITEYYQRTIR